MFVIRLCALGLCLIVWGSTVSPSRAGPAADLERAQQAIGRLTGALGSGGCTAVMVGPRTALTARHCATARGASTLRPGLAVVTAAGRHRIVGHRLADVSPFDDDGRLSLPANDWVWLELDSAAALPSVEMVGVGGLLIAEDDGAALIKLTHSARSPADEIAHSVCRILDMWWQESVFTFRCSPPGGHGGPQGVGRSGSPLFVATEDGLALVGIHIAKVEQDGRQFGLAVMPPMT